MNEIFKIILLTTVSGACMPLGGLFARIERIQPSWLEEEFRHFVIAMGGGILLGAVSNVLIPEGISSVGDSLWAIPITCMGGLFFFFIESRLGKQHYERPQLIGMLLDYLPEAIALGGLVALQSSTAFLLAILIGLQSLPEGFNTYRELIHQGTSPNRAIQFLGLLVLMGPLAGLSGFFFLAAHPHLLGTIMLLASGGILYLIFQDIAPQSHLESHWFPPLGAVLGFCLALFGEMLVNT